MDTEGEEADDPVEVVTGEQEDIPDEVFDVSVVPDDDDLVELEVPHVLGARPRDVVALLAMM